MEHFVLSIFVDGVCGWSSHDDNWQNQPKRTQTKGMEINNIDKEKNLANKSAQYRKYSLK